jgi:hypothetical protein
MLDARAVLWDLDGTLVDTEDYHWRAWREILRGEGETVTQEQFLASFGQRNDVILARWLGPGAEPERVRRFGEAKEAFHRRLVETEGARHAGMLSIGVRGASTAAADLSVRSLAALPADAFWRLIAPQALSVRARACPGFAPARAAAAAARRPPSGCG